MSKIFGLAPFSFTNKEKCPEGEISFKSSNIILRCAWNIALLVGACSYACNLTVSSEKSVKSVLCYIFGSLLMSCSDIITIILSHSANRKKLSIILTKFYKVD
jgi:hypothetical protein